MTVYADRVAAGVALAAALEAWRGTDAVVVGIPRGGVVVAAAVARELQLPLTAVAVRKLGVPAQSEVAAGAIAQDVRVLNDEAVARRWLTSDQLAAVERRERVELQRRTDRYGLGEADLTGRTAIVVDDGVATGATATAACRAVRAQGAARVVLAAPVAPARWRPPPDAADDWVCVQPVRDFWAVGQFYERFNQTSDEEVVALLHDTPRR
ncbi:MULTISPECIES: phosphoribosyltransferase family protein [unclassified Microbacterium]|uniref:phosphoribosyltransferase n=1 Tax=unclassified Microbacterium TaxID=2609290 RepID=UPI00214C88E5|nr:MULTISPECIES: phosphoribosyltransferase family protein [unclassified Microbacterium]MCR2785719.1 phosphoribosyltransferase family protein [Microbacterium sp. zg.B96]MDL5350164.1 phosphoribosyltransferase family protein [Microbacterium sp. zg-YB36]WIM17297.1 phosphoribosyltransferase family protein [Microbacterium sp. zg-B96]